MKYLFFILSFLIFSSAVKAQSSTEILTIDKKLEEAKNSTGNPKQEEMRLLQLKAASEKLAYEKGILLSSDYLMSVFEKQNKNKETIELGNQLKKIIQNKKEDPTGVISSIYRKNALALMYLGLDDASKKDIEKAIEFSKTIVNPDRKYFRLAQNYMDLHSHYNNRNNQSENKINKDSTLYYLNKSLEVAKKIRDNNGEIPNNRKYAQILETYMRLGIFYLQYSDEKGNLKLAENNLLKAEQINENHKGSLSMWEECVLLNQLSWLYMEKKEYQKSIDYANRALQLEKHYSRPTARVESFEFLATNYMEIGDKEKSKFYMQKYTVLKDSINIAGRKNADVTMKKMITETGNEYKKSSNKKMIIIGVLIMIAIIILFILWRRQNMLIHKKYETLITKLSHKEENILSNEDVKNKETKTVPVITDDISKSMLQKLEKFEKSEKYLRKDISLAWLAHYLDTNTKYLSEGIKIHRDNNFSDYINGLKINYIVNKLYESPIYRKYKISYLSQECGYATPQVFRSSFKKETGITPSYFIENIKKDIEN